MRGGVPPREVRCIDMANITAVYTENTNYYQNGTTVPVPAVPVPEQSLQYQHQNTQLCTHAAQHQ